MFSYMEGKKRLIEKVMCFWGKIFCNFFNPKPRGFCPEVWRIDLVNFLTDLGMETVQVYNWVVVSNIFYFHPYLGKIPILTNIFQMGWNHQPDKN